MGQTYKIPEETAELFDDYISAENCRDQCVKSVFKARRAIYYGREAMKAKRKFWKQVREMYPELDGKKLTYNIDSQQVSVAD